MYRQPGSRNPLFRRRLKVASPRTGKVAKDAWISAHYSGSTSERASSRVRSYWDTECRYALAIGSGMNLIPVCNPLLYKNHQTPGHLSPAPLCPLQQREDSTSPMQRIATPAKRPEVTTTSHLLYRSIRSFCLAQLGNPTPGPPPSLVVG